MDRRNMLLVFAAAVSMTAGAPKDPPTKLVGVGDLIYRIEIKEALPNAFGKADIFGRKRTTGFVELRYMGLDADGKAVVRRTDVSVLNNETTLSRGPGVITNFGNSSGPVFFNKPREGMRETLPAGTIDIAIDMAGERTILINGQLIEVLEASAGRAKVRGPIAVE